jgi:hypothetical protein
VAWWSKIWLISAYRRLICVNVLVLGLEEFFFLREEEFSFVYVRCEVSVNHGSLSARYISQAFSVLSFLAEILD